MDLLQMQLIVVLNVRYETYPDSISLMTKVVCSSKECAPVAE